jgi:hypothetical protein
MTEPYSPSVRSPLLLILRSGIPSSTKIFSSSRYRAGPRGTLRPVSRAFSALLFSGVMGPVRAVMRRR